MYRRKEINNNLLIYAPDLRNPRARDQRRKCPGCTTSCEQMRVLLYYILYAVQCYYVGRYLYDMRTDNNQFVRVCAVRVYIYVQ